MKAKSAKRWLDRNKWKIAEAKTIRAPTKKFRKQYHTCLRLRRF